MSDRGWLGFGGRVRTPQPAQQPANPKTQSEVVDHAPPALHRSATRVHVQQQQDRYHKPPKLARISSYMGLGAVAKSHSPTASTYPEGTLERSESMRANTLRFDSTGLRLEKENGNFFNRSDVTWHNPSLKQMVETVSCEMMKNGSSAPIPRHLNGWIASIFEEVSHLFCELRDLRAEIDELKATRQNELREFSAMTDEWEQREGDYKAEINRLEHIISDTQQGAESVLLARAGSVINRDDGQAFRAKVDRLSRSEDEDVTLDRNHDYIIEFDKRNSVALSTGDVFSVDTSPYKTIGRMPRFLKQDCDANLEQQFRSTTSKRRSKPDQNLGAKMAAARISVEMTGKPPAPSVKGRTSARNSNSSSSSSSRRASSSSSLITQGFLAEQLAQAQVTPNTSPTKHDNLCRRPVKGPATGCDVLETIRELAAKKGGLPDSAIEEDSSYASTVHLSQQRRAFSFTASDNELGAPGDPHKAQVSQRPQQSTAEERSSSSQLDAITKGRGNVVNSNNQPSGSSENSSGEESSNSRSSKTPAMGHDRVTDVGKDGVTTVGGTDLDGRAGLVQMTEVMVIQRDAIANNLRVSPNKKVQGRRVPRTSQSSTDEETERQRMMMLNHTKAQAHLSKLSDEEFLALATHYFDGSKAPSAVKRLPSSASCSGDAAAAAAATALKRSTSGQKGQPNSQAQAA
ncbi:hypothetical protein VPNG_02298 [Cytospora leucostoma]|uniref:Uncharacterized protein n=1 Tax=Cytospora leucostoma TaxID=1230097 RepID=A0A423XH64_9PEZI|nr:hypothetical protein VPNG_02298 [Cytospora leucostoma]